LDGVEADDTFQKVHLGASEIKWDSNAKPPSCCHVDITEEPRGDLLDMNWVQGFDMIENIVN
jgi:hypothetical protein